MEEWRAIPGYENLYEASTHGRIRSVDRTIQCSNRVVRRVGKVLRVNLDSRGYAQVCLCNHTKRKTHLVHRLILTTFIGPHPIGSETCHHDGIRTNNRLDNLRWDTRSENSKDRIRHGTHNWMVDGKMKPPKAKSSPVVLHV